MCLATSCLLRLQHGGCHTVDGCQDRTPFSGASFQYLSANVMRGAQTLFPATAVKVVDAVNVGLIGLAFPDLFVAHLAKHSPLRPGPLDRIVLKR